MLVTPVRPRSPVAPVVVLLLSMAVSDVEGSPRTDVYEITSGTFSEVGGGWIYRVDFDLPDESQRFIELTTDGEAAGMHILDAQFERWQAYDPFPSTGDLPFDGGIVDGDVIGFVETQETLIGRGSLSYTVTLDEDSLTLNGSLWVDQPRCFDCPTQFYHTDVHARFVPEPPMATFLLMGLLAVFARRRCLA